MAINEAFVTNEAGEIIWQAVPGSYYQLDDTRSVAADTDKVIHIPVERLEVENRLHLVTTRNHITQQTTYDLITGIRAIIDLVIRPPYGSRQRYQDAIS